MPETKKTTTRIEFEASTGLFVVHCGTLIKSEHVPDTWTLVLGGHSPVARVSIHELPPEHRAAFEAFCEYLAPVVEERFGAPETDPQKVHELAVANEVRAAAIAKARAEADEHVAQQLALATKVQGDIATLEAARLEAEAERAQAEMNAAAARLEAEKARAEMKAAMKAKREG
jgi:hypothetical protein